MSIKSRLILTVLGIAAVLLGCAAKAPVTDWYYSSWVSKDGAASKASFEEARTTCLAQSGVRDPAAVPIGGETEQEFIECMDAARWCTAARGCD
jgi:hypothetical protein